MNHYTINTLLNRARCSHRVVHGGVRVQLPDVLSTTTTRYPRLQLPQPWRKIVSLMLQKRTCATNSSTGFNSMEQFGPNGHDYKLSERAEKSISPLHEDAIHKLISERMKCKLHSDFSRADAIEKQLNEAHVRIDDGNKVWRSDGKRFASCVYDYAYYRESFPNISNMPVQQIKALMRERLACRFNRDYATADKIRVVLQASGIYMHDTARLWRADGKPFEFTNK